MKEKGIMTYVVMILVIVLLCCYGVAHVNSQRVPALFVFGDSLVDVGRFSNGKSLIDFIGDMLGVPSPPPFLDSSTTGQNMLNGVNFASASGGILDDSGRHYGDRHSMSRQIQNFGITLNQYRTMMNATALNQFLAKSIVIVVTGNNDYINNYLLPGFYGTSRNYSAPQFANLLLNTFSRQLLALQSLGLRRFFLGGIGPLGCIPNQRARGAAPFGRCVDSVNQMVVTYNAGLRSLVEQLNRDHSDSMFVYGNTYNVFGDILNHPNAYAFTVIDRACCGIGLNRAQVSCLPMQLPCLNRDQHVFWDAFHPTQSAVYVFAWRAVNGPQTDCYPINIKQMALL
ncbi:GDSL Lipase/Acylhydrolase superfamily protein [Trifolium repens]|nr:GDSL Lipase/Acylhydrolase superfamily protein [Trifolium repens]